MSIGATNVNPCAIAANCAVDMVKKTFLEANLQSFFPYLVTPARVLDSIGPAVLILGTAGTILSSHKNMTTKCEEFELETRGLLTDKNITPMPVDLGERRSVDGIVTVWALVNTANIMMYIVNLGFGLGMGSFVNSVQTNENMMLTKINGLNSSIYCKTPGDAQVFFKLFTGQTIDTYGDNVDIAIGQNVGILATVKIIAAVTSIFSLLTSVYCEHALGVFKNNKKHFAIVLTMSLAYTAWLALGIYQAIMSNQVSIGSNLNRGWNDNCSLLVRS